MDIAGNMTRLNCPGVSILKSKQVRNVSQKMRQLTCNPRMVFGYLQMTENACAPA